LAVWALLLTAPLVHAGPGRAIGASLNLDAGYEHSEHFKREAIGIGLRAGISPGRTVLAMAGMDLELGLSQPAGFAYAFRIYPVGLGIVMGELGRLTLVAGVGASGGTGEIGAAGQIPVEARFDVRLGARLRLELAAAVHEVFLQGEREDGASRAPFADELQLSARIRIGKSFSRGAFRSSNGYYLGVRYREFAGIETIGMMVGHSLDFTR